ncbi:MAG: preprotein translocase subunit Sec61beta [Nanoarchaeota archaeon]
MANTGVNLPGGYGGLVRFSDEYASKINLKPEYIIGFIILIIVLRVLLPVFFK